MRQAAQNKKSDMPGLTTGPERVVIVASLPATRRQHAVRGIRQPAPARNPAKCL
jgi:hypothetical protein